MVCDYRKKKSSSSSLVQNINLYSLHAAVGRPVRPMSFLRFSNVISTEPTKLVNFVMVDGTNCIKVRRPYIFLKSAPTPEFLRYNTLVCDYRKKKSSSSSLVQNNNHYLLHEAVREPGRPTSFLCHFYGTNVVRIFF